MPQRVHELPEIDALEVAARGLSQRGATGLTIHEIVAVCMFARQTAGALEELILHGEDCCRREFPIGGQDILNMLHRHGLYPEARARALRDELNPTKEDHNGQDEDETPF